MKFQLGIIGAGVMANAILTQVLNSKVLKENQITIFDKMPEKLEKLSVHKSANVQELVNDSQMVLFAVKPQNYSEICDEVIFRENLTVLSIMAGVKIATFRSRLKVNCPITRIMPNTPCMLGKGFCGLCFDGVEGDNLQLITDIFRACGDIIVIDESLFDTVTSISGSGPAYVYMFIDAMIKGGQKGGLDYEDSKKMAIATVIGAAEMVRHSELPLETLIERVCSKGGTTIEAVDVYRNKGLTDIIVAGIDACRNKSKLLSEKH